MTLMIRSPGFEEEAGGRILERVNPALAAFLTDVLLRDGRTVTVRALRPTDAEALVAFGREIAPAAIRSHERSPTASAGGSTDMIAADGDHQVVLTAWAGSTLVGLSSYVRDTGRPDRAEVTFAVSPQFQGRGIATLLLETLARIARPRDIQIFDAFVPQSNRSMLSVFYDSGFTVSDRVEDDVLHVHSGPCPFGRAGRAIGGRGRSRRRPRH